MKKLLLFFFLCSSAAWAAVPTIIHSVSCPNSQGNAGALGGTYLYRCPIPATLSGNLLVLGMIYDSTNNPTWTISDQQGDTWTQAVTNTTVNSNIQRVYYAMNVTAGSTYVTMSSTISACCVTAQVAEFNNVATTSALDHANCNRVSSATITAGATGTLVAGDLLVQFFEADDSTASGSITVGSQSNITWALAQTNLLDSTGIQWGQYNSTATINPTLTQGTSHATASCVAAFKNATAGTVDTAAIKILRVLHQGMNTGAANPYVFQTPALGSTLIIAFDSGGNTVTGITTSPSVTCTSTGTAATRSGGASQMFYCPLTSTSGAMTLSATRNATTSDGTFIVYDVTGLDAAPLTADSGGQTGTNATQGASFTTCSSCITPTTSNGLVIGTAEWDNCTATAITAPSPSSTAVFNRARYQGNPIDGPQAVDQNNGAWFYLNPNTSAVTGTFTMDCTGSLGSTIGGWSGRAAAFKAASASVTRRRAMVISR